jgi:hypothetical protein
VWGLFLVLIAAASGVVHADQADEADKAAGHADQATEPHAQPVWHGPDGRPLPFATTTEVLDFLRTAEVVSMTELPKGATKPEKVLLEKNGVRMHAIFRSYRRTQERTLDPVSGQVLYGDFTDSAMSEAAAYELARLLELPFVPPTVRRTIGNRDGTLQLWIEGAETAEHHIESGTQPPHADWWRGVQQTLTIFDNLVFNTDRHMGNLLIDSDWTVWFIDHTRAFQLRRQLRNPEIIKFTERRLWRRLQTVTDDDIRGRLSPFLGSRELMALLARRDRLVAHIEGLIAANGENAVLFDYSYDLADWRGQ